MRPASTKPKAINCRRITSSRFIFRLPVSVSFWAPTSTENFTLEVMNFFSTALSFTRSMKSLFWICSAVRGFTSSTTAFFLEPQALKNNGIATTAIFTKLDVFILLRIFLVLSF